MTGKHKIEYRITEQGFRYLNYWDWAHGRDVVCIIRDGKLFLQNPDDTEEEISFYNFIALVDESIDKIGQLI